MVRSVRQVNHIIPGAGQWDGIFWQLKIFLNILPENHPDRAALITILQKTCDALLKVRDPKTGLWYQVLNKGGREGNYLEGSGSAMYTYAFASGAHKGYLDTKVPCHCQQRI